MRTLLFLLLAALAASAQQSPVLTIWKSYPVYHPDQAPPNYIEWLRSQDPQKIWPPEDLKTENDWIRAGEIVFDAPLRIGGLAARPPSDPPYLHDKAWFDKVKPPVARDGSITGYVYIIREKGKVEVASLSCATCHARVMPNGAIAKGAQGNFPHDAAFAEDLITAAGKPALRVINKQIWNTYYNNPAFTGARALPFTENYTLTAAAKLLEGRPAGVVTPNLSDPWNPIQIPDLFGVQNRKYLDHTGRYSGDLVRYPIDHHPGEPTRFSDEQLQALAKYLTNLKAPQSPYKLDKFSRQGAKVFEREGCAGCHAPPLYTNNKVIPAAEIGTDPSLTTTTRLATGNYKVPALTGLWYKGALTHTGTITTLEELFSPTRLQYYKGHEFGLNISGTDRFALIAFLRTL